MPARRPASWLQIRTSVWRAQHFGGMPPTRANFAGLNAITPARTVRAAPIPTCNHPRDGASSVYSANRGFARAFGGGGGRSAAVRDRPSCSPRSARAKNRGVGERPDYEPVEVRLGCSTRSRIRAGWDAPPGATVAAQTAVGVTRGCGGGWGELRGLAARTG